MIGKLCGENVQEHRLWFKPPCFDHLDRFWPSGLAVFIEVVFTPGVFGDDFHRINCMTANFGHAKQSTTHAYRCRIAQCTYKNDTVARLRIAQKIVAIAFEAKHNDGPVRRLKAPNAGDKYLPKAPCRFATSARFLRLQPHGAGLCQTQGLAAKSSWKNHGRPLDKNRRMLDCFKPAECANYLRHRGYGAKSNASSSKENALICGRTGLSSCPAQKPDRRRGAARHGRPDGGRALQ